MKISRQYNAIKDTREREGHGYTFFKSSMCLGTVRRKLDVGDYCLEGFEQIFAIERKGAVTEFVANLTQARFKKELERGAHLKHIWLLLEFNMTELIDYPKIKEVPRKLLRRIRFKGHAALMRTLELQIQYPNVHVLFVGPDKGLEVAGSIFKRMVEAYGEEVDSSEDSTDS